MIGAAHERADWRNEDRLIADRLDRYLRPHKYDNGPEYVWTEHTVLDIADIITDHLADNCADCEAHDRAPAAWRPCEKHEQDRQHFPLDAYTVTCQGLGEPNAWAITRGEKLIVGKLTMDAAQAFVEAIDHGEPEAVARQRAADLARTAAQQ